jgi:hypothetical protein
MAGRDIRRLVALAPMASAPEKVLRVRRVVAGIEAVGARALVADDGHGIAREAAFAARGRVDLLAVPPGEDGPEATRAAVAALTGAGVAVLVALGGDGTQRAVARAAPSVPVLPLAGGTNNVACWTGDETAAGIAAGLVALGAVPAGEVGRPAKVLVVGTEDGEEDLALVDVALVRTAHVGALAVWEAQAVQSLVLAVADPTRPGLSNVGGFVAPLTAADDTVLVLDLDQGPRFPGVLAPGAVGWFAVRGYRRVPLGVPVCLRSERAATVALDGERTRTVHPGEMVRVRGERRGPVVLDPEAVLGHFVAAGRRL